MPWFRKWFNHHYLQVYAHRSRREARRDIDRIERIVPLHRSQPILDLACGAGRHALELASRGYSVVGLDLSRPLLSVAKDSALAAGVDLPLVCADARDIPFIGKFGTVLNLFTSFGYFSTEEENALVLRSISRCLRPGGRFLIDHINKELAVRSLVPEDRREIGGLMVIQKRRFDDRSQRLEKTIILTENGIEKVYEESVRLYRSEELAAMAEAAGLVVKSVFGGLDGRPIDSDAPRMIILGDKPE